MTAATARGPITLLTDFGTRDGYAAALRGVILDIAPHASVHDAAHDIPRGDVAAAAACLARYWRLYPAGAIHVVVVDPGVGSDRAALLVEAAGRFLIGPDNGVLTPALDQDGARARRITEARYTLASRSATFHGRDVFAPAAAHLARGVEPQRFGDTHHDPVRLASPAVERTAAGIRGSVVEVDRFGNLITNIAAADLAAAQQVELAGRSIPVRTTYSDVAAGELVALIGSDGRLEIAVRDGSAAAALAAGRDAAVLVPGTEPRRRRPAAP